MPDSEESSFKTWWRSLTESTVVSVRLPIAAQGNAGKPSNSAKKAVLEDFLAFVDANSEPNDAQIIQLTTLCLNFPWFKLPKLAALITKSVQKDP